MKPYYDEDGITIYHGDCREVAVTAHAVITDPPYSRDALPHWSWLAAVATSALPAGGWLAAYSGGAHLPEVFRRLAVDELAYFWTLATTYRGGGQVLFREGASILTEWKPVLVYRRRPFSTPKDEAGRFVSDGGHRYSFSDLLHRGGREKTLHPWAQPLSEASALVDRFSRPGDVVLDPFAGSGTTLVAAQAAGRRAIGIEIEEKYCEIAVQRLAQGVLPLEAVQ